MIPAAMALAVATARIAGPVADPPSPADLLRTHCLACHSVDGSAPLRFDTFEGVRRHRGLMRRLIDDRTMPPWLPGDGGVPLAHRRALDEPTRTALLAALETAESTTRAFATLDVAGRPPLPPFDAGCPDRFGPQPPWVLPAEGGMRIRTYLVEVGSTAPERVRGVRFADPGTLASSPLRFVSLAPDPRRELAVLEEPHEPGFESMGNVGAIPSGALGAMSRVATAFELPEGFAFRLPRGAVAIETLAEPVGRRQPVEPRLVWIPASPGDARTVRAIALGPSGLVLEPGEVSDRIVERRTAAPLELVGVIVKGGAFLRRVRLEAIRPDGTRALLLEVPDFRMPLAEPWLFREPVRLDAGGRLALCLSFDNAESNPLQPARPPRRVTAGLPPNDEDATCVVLVADPAG